MFDVLPWAQNKSKHSKLVCLHGNEIDGFDWSVMHTRIVRLVHLHLDQAGHQLFPNATL